MTSANSNIFDDLGLNPVINGRSWVTRLGGRRMGPEVSQAMYDAADTFVDFNELNKLAGERIAEYTGAEAGLVVSGA